MVAATPEMLSPQHTGISVTVADPGVLIIDVPSSEMRPHCSNVHHQYFRRGSDGTRILEHAEIRELMFLTREAKLEIDCVLRSSSSTGDLRFSLLLTLLLRNTGRVPVIGPYIKLSQQGTWSVTHVEHLGVRTRLEGFGIYGTRDVLVHVDDDLGIAECPTGLDFRRTGHYQIKAAIETISKNGEHCFQMRPFSDMRPLDQATNDQPIFVFGTFGTENVAAQNFEFKIGKMELLALFCRHHAALLN